MPMQSSSVIMDLGREASNFRFQCVPLLDPSQGRNVRRHAFYYAEQWTVTAWFFGVRTMEEEQDQRQFFKDLGATAEQTVQEARGVEEDYFVLLQRMLIAFPWV